MNYAIFHIRASHFIPFIPPALSPLGESDLWTPMGSIGPQKSGRVDRTGVFFSRGGPGEGVPSLRLLESRSPQKGRV